MVCLPPFFKNLHVQTLSLISSPLLINVSLNCFFFCQPEGPIKLFCRFYPFDFVFCETPLCFSFSPHMLLKLVFSQTESPCGLRGHVRQNIWVVWTHFMSKSSIYWSELEQIPSFKWSAWFHHPMLVESKCCDAVLFRFGRIAKVFGRMLKSKSPDVKSRWRGVDKKPESLQWDQVLKMHDECCEEILSKS